MIRRTLLLLMSVTVLACASSGRGDVVDGCSLLAPPPLSAVVSDSAMLHTRLAGLLDGAPQRASFTVRFRPDEDEVVLVRDSAGRSEALLDSLEAAVLVSLIKPGEEDDLNSHRLVFADGRLSTRGIQACPPSMLNRSELATALQRAQSRIRGDGTALLWILVDESGTPVEVTVQQSSGSDAIDAAAMGVGYIARFSPGSLDGIPVRVYIEMPIQLAMRG